MDIETRYNEDISIDRGRERGPIMGERMLGQRALKIGVAVAASLDNMFIGDVG